MVEVHQYRASVSPQEDTREPCFAPIDSTDTGTEKDFCAYNETAQRFISNQVEVVDLPLAVLESRLSELTPDSGMALWILPIQELSPSLFRFPVDLLYLSEDGTVLEVMHSFPLVCASPVTARAESILALPARNLLLPGIEVGDKLILCSPAEMESRLLQAFITSTTAEPQPVSEHVFATDEHEKSGIDPVSSFSRDAGIFSSSIGQQHENFVQMETPAALSVPASSKPEDPEIASESMPPPEKMNTPRKKTWWQKLFPDDPEEDARQSPRQALPGLVAYFFTGGTPVAHPVRNISTSGVYILTAERWYKGTVVRLTLTDEREPTSERSITLHGIVARTTKEGIALQFIVGEKPARRTKGSPLEHLPEGSSARQIEEFILRFKSRI